MATLGPPERCHFNRPHGLGYTVNLLPNTIALPTPEMIVDALPGRKFSEQYVSTTPGNQHTENSIERGLKIEPAGAVVSVGDWQIGRDEVPFGGGEIAGIRFDRRFHEAVRYSVSIAMA